MLDWLKVRAPAAASVPAAAPVPPMPPAWPVLAILDAALRVPHASSAAELADALAARRTPPGLDPALADDDGFPVMTARCAAADDADAIAREAGADLSLDDEGWRALALAGAVVDELAARLAGDAASAAGLPVLALAALAPPGWTAMQHAAARRWLHGRIVRAGWPADRVVIDEDGGGVADPAPVLERAAARLALVVACDSAIGADTIGRWAAQGMLLSASHAQGFLPGEGAVALLVDGVAGAPPGAVCATLAESLGADPASLAGLTAAVLQRADVAPDDVALLVADTGHRTGPVLELARHAAQALPQLDGADGVVRAGLACGTCGAVPWFAALALAWHHVRVRGAPVLCVANEDPGRRRIACLRRKPM